MYKKLIESACYCWIKKEYDDAIKFFEEALKHKQEGRTTKKQIKEIIQELKNERLYLHRKTV